MYGIAFNGSTRAHTTDFAHVLEIFGPKNRLYRNLAKMGDVSEFLPHKYKVILTVEEEKELILMFTK